MVHQRIGGQLRMMASGGAALPAETQELWERIGVRIVQGYGASECSPVIACGAGDGSTPIGSVGRPLRGVDVKLSAEGEVLAHGPNVMRGYWRDPERTAEVLSDGWYATGDLATIDAAGNIRLSGRARDLIVLPSGMNVWPQDVEDALRADPASPTRPSSPSRLRRRRDAARLSHSGVRAARSVRTQARSSLALMRRLAQHQRSDGASWWRWRDFPRTAIGKVRRTLLPRRPQRNAGQGRSGAGRPTMPLGRRSPACAGHRGRPGHADIGGVRSSTASAWSSWPRSWRRSGSAA